MTVFLSAAGRTGIDIGDGSVKVVRVTGRSRAMRITHAGIETWDTGGPSADPPSATPAAAALERLLRRLKLGRSKLGRVAAALGGEDVVVQEVDVPPMSDTEIRSALPFEAKKSLFLQGMSEPKLGYQVLSRNSVSADPDATGASMRLLLAAGSGARRAWVLDVLAHAGVEPEVIDLEPLSSLNAVLAEIDPTLIGDKAVGVLDLGSRLAELHLTHPKGGVLSRPVGPGFPRDASPDYFDGVLSRVQETLTYYRGRHHQDVGRLFLIGGGACAEDRLSRLTEGSSVPMDVFDPIRPHGPEVQGFDEVARFGPRLALAYGLSRWWDDGRV